ncbi:MAG: DUF2339 domain-containing protein, partial [Planctomycetia bacterium]|nr:DUF2339 domain-containing protein [Planctomycetia bacterium]
MATEEELPKKKSEVVQKTVSEVVTVKVPLTLDASTVENWNTESGTVKSEQETTVKTVVKLVPKKVEMPEMSRGWNWFWYGREVMEPDADREFIAASNWLIRIGMLILVLGLGFFVKFSIDRGWVSPEMRILGTTLLGLGMYAVGGLLWKTTLNLLGQALVAGGACVLYFSAFGTTVIYHLIPDTYGLAWCCAVTLILVVSALRWNSQLIAALGMLGAYLSPVIFPFWKDNLPALAIYLVILALGIWLIRRFRAWLIPAWIALVGTGYLWVSNIQPTLAEPFSLHVLYLGVTLFFLVAFHFSAQRWFRVRPVSATAWELAFAFISWLIFATTFYGFLKGWVGEKVPFQFTEEIVWQFDTRIHTVTFIIMPIYLMAAFLMKHVGENRSFRALNVGLATLTILLGVSEFETWRLPLIFIACVCFQSMCERIPHYRATLCVRVGAAILAVYALTKLLGIIFIEKGAYPWGWSTFWTSRVPELNLIESLELWTLPIPELWSRTLHFLTPGVCLVLLAVSAWRSRNISGFLGEKHADTRLAMTRTFAQYFAGVSIFYLWMWVSLEMNFLVGVHYPLARLGAVSVTWTVFALGLLGIGIRWNLRAVRYTSLAFFGLVMLKVALVDLSALNGIYRILAFIVLGLLILAGGTIYLKCT